MKLYIKLTESREKIIDQFKITDRDDHIYNNLNEAAIDALNRAFKDINFRTLQNPSQYQQLVDKLFNSSDSETYVCNEEDQEQKIVYEIFKIEHPKNITNYLIKRLKKAGFIEAFVNYFSDDYVNDEQWFDSWHHTICDKFYDVLKLYYKDAKYGKTQKIVNMMFKHLYCMNFGKNEEKDKSDWRVLNEEFFDHCHLTLDSFTLEWFWREIGDSNNIKGLNNNYKIIKGKIDQWSNLQFREFEKDVTSRVHRLEKYNTCDNNCLIITEKKEQTSDESNDDSKMECEPRYHYMFFVDIIRQFFPKTNPPPKTKTLTSEQKRYEHLTPFQAEFYIWPEIQLHLTAEALFGQSIGQEEMITAIDEVKKKENEEELKTKENELEEKKRRYPNRGRKGLEDEIKKIKTPVQDMDEAKKIYRKLPLEKKLEILQTKINILINHSKGQPTENQNGRT